MKIFWKELARGKGLWRAFLYDAASSYGAILRMPLADIACGKNPGYRRILGIAANDTGVTTVDSDPSVHASVVHDMASGPLPFDDGSFNTAILFNCMYAFSEPRIVMKEAYRILASQGTLLVSFPLIFPYTPEPRDFFRFTEESVRILCAEAGFAVTSIQPLGGRFTSAAYLALPFPYPYSLLVFPAYVLAVIADRLALFFFPSLHPAPIGYFAVARRA